MERSRLRTLLGIGLIVIGVIFLGQALAHTALPPLPALPALPPLPAPPPLPPLPALPPPPPVPFPHGGGWFSPPLLLGLIALMLVWRRRCVSRR